MAAASRGTLVPARSKGGVEELTGVGVSPRPGNHTPEGSGDADASSASDAQCAWHRAERSPRIVSFAPCTPLRGGASISFPWMQTTRLKEVKGPVSNQVAEERCWNPGRFPELKDKNQDTKATLRGGGNGGEKTAKSRF